MLQDRADHQRSRLRTRDVADGDRHPLTEPDELAQRWARDGCLQGCQQRPHWIRGSGSMARSDHGGPARRHLDRHAGLAVREIHRAGGLRDHPLNPVGLDSGWIAVRSLRSRPRPPRRPQGTVAGCGRRRRRRVPSRDDITWLKRHEPGTEGDQVSDAVDHLVGRGILQALAVHQERMRRACGSGISSVVTSHGPIGQKESRLLPRVHWPSPNWTSRAEMSSRHV